MRMSRFSTEKPCDISVEGQVVAPRTKNKFNPSEFAPEYNHISNKVVPHMLTVGALAPTRWVRKKPVEHPPGPIGEEG